MTNQFSQFHFEEDGVIYLKPCFMFTLYWQGSIFTQTESILNMYHVAWNAVKDHVKFFQTDSMKKTRKVRKDTGDLVPFWLKDKPGTRGIYILAIDNRDSFDAAPDAGLEFFAPEYRGVGAINLFLPVEVVEQSPEKLVTLATNLAKDITFASGNAGYALNFTREGDYYTSAEWSAFPLCFRYPGLEYNSLSNTSFALQEGFKRVNWLTFLNLDQCEKLGGIKELEKKFSSDIIIHPLAKGIMIQAGAMPAIGDVNRQQFLPLYHEVGRVLAPVRAKKPPEFLVPPGWAMADKEKTNEWLSVFDS